MYASHLANDSLQNQRIAINTVNMRSNTEHLPLFVCYDLIFTRSVKNLTTKKKQNEKKVAVLTSVIRIKNGFPNVW